MVTDIEQKKEKKKSSFGSKKVSTEDVAIFSRQMATMISAGIPVTQCLRALSGQTSNKTLSAAITDITENIEGGTSLSDAFGSHRAIFGDLYISMLAAGEVGGILEKTLLALANQLQKDKQLKSAVKSATTYPKMVGSFAIVITIVMLIVMVPTFQKMIPATADINPITAFVFALSGSIRTRWYIYIVAIIAAVFIIKFIIKTPVAHGIWEANKMKLPLIGELISKTILARFCRTLATLLNGGVTAVQALESAGPTSGSDLIAKAITEAIADIEDGKSIHESIEKSHLFPPMLVSMVAIGEDSGTLPLLLDKVAEFYEDDVQAISANLGSILEPIMLVMLGTIVGGMVIALYLPVFQATTAGS
ncbi:MAG: type II secretion system F family protein [Clostridiales bacterium]|nr:type II secretion system F family protein [Clostridiales bacterium]